jgi:CBS domain-containing protein
MNIGEVCTRTIVFTQQNSTILEAAQLMRSHHVGDLVVMDEGGEQSAPVGIITDRDIVLAVVAKNVAPDTITVGDVMGEELMVAKEEDGIWETLQRMRRKGVRRIPVVSEKEALVGIFTLDDALELMAEEINELVNLIKQEQIQEEAVRT